ncbi:MAG: glycosyltransferase family 4 protein [Desulfobacterales bacterium]|nr:glycosyltransferase family 4 protein [Desulfobacterales bacterium]
MVAGKITVVQMLPGLHSGGVERGTLELGRYLCEKGHKSIVISAGGGLTCRLENEGSTHVTWPVGEKSPRCLLYILRLRNLLVRERVDILHLRSRLPAWIGFFAWKSLPEKKRPVLITTFHGFYSVNPYSRVMTRGERVIAISKVIARHMEAKYKVSREKIVIIPRGVDEKAFDPDAVSRDRMAAIAGPWKLKKDLGPVILLPGRISRWKGQDVFIQSLALIRDLSWCAFCVGDKTENRSYAARLQKLISESGLKDRVSLPGHCDDMPAALMLADVVVSAASTEPEAFGRIAVEAQAMGKPVVASAHGGSLETVQHGKTGWLVKPDDPHSMAGALREAISNEKLRFRFGSAGQRWVRENFTTRKMCRRTLDLYLELVTDKRKTEA